MGDLSSRSKAPARAVICTVYNESATIRRFLDSYHGQSVHADELIIVDGGSTDDTASIIGAYATRHPELKIRLIVDRSCSRGATLGPIARGRNVAIRATAASLIAATDAGCKLDQNWLSEILKPLINNTDPVVVSGRFEGVGENAFQGQYIRHVIPPLSRFSALDFLPSSRSLAFHRECWDAVGGYPESTFAGEDTLFDIKMQRAGCRFVPAPTAVVYWEVPRNRAEAFRKHRQYGIGDGTNRLFLTRALLRAPLMPLYLLLIAFPGIGVRSLVSFAYFVGYYSALTRSGVPPFVGFQRPPDSDRE